MFRRRFPAVSVNLNVPAYTVFRRAVEQLRRARTHRLWTWGQLRRSPSTPGHLLGMGTGHRVRRDFGERADLQEQRRADRLAEPWGPQLAREVSPLPLFSPPLVRPKKDRRLKWPNSRRREEALRPTSQKSEVPGEHRGQLPADKLDNSGKGTRS